MLVLSSTGNVAAMEVLRPSLESDMSSMGKAIANVGFASIINYFFPLNIFMEYMFTRKTKRKPGDLSFDFLNELILFIITLNLQYQLNENSKRNDKNPFKRDGLSSDQAIAAEIVFT